MALLLKDVSPIAGGGITLTSRDRVVHDLLV